MRVPMASASPQCARPLLLIGRQLPREDRDEDDVVDPKHDLESGECDEGDPNLGRSYPIHEVPAFLVRFVR